MTDEQKFNKEEREFLDEFEHSTLAAEMGQAQELDILCDVSFQYAKTHSTYLKDWEDTKRQMLEALQADRIPDGLSKEVFAEMILIIDRIIEKKLAFVRHNFQRKFREPIYNYLGSDGKTRGCLGVILLFGFVASLSFIWIVT